MENFIDGGYDYNWVDEKRADEFRCPICKSILKQPKILPCKHSFCKECLRLYIDNKLLKGVNLKCPLCRKIFQDHEVSTDNEINTYIKYNLMHSMPCGTKINVIGTFKHRAECELCNMIDGAYTDNDELVPVPQQFMQFIRSKLFQLSEKYGVKYKISDGKLYINGRVSGKKQMKCEIATLIVSKDRERNPQNYADDEDYDYAVRNDHFRYDRRTHTWIQGLSQAPHTSNITNTRVINADGSISFTSRFVYNSDNHITTSSRIRMRSQWRDPEPE